MNESEAVAARMAQMSVRVTRKSARVEQFVPFLTSILRAVVLGAPAAEIARQAAEQLYGELPDAAAPDPVVACYIDPNFQSLLHFLNKYTDFRAGVLANANAGGENVHRGLVLGAVLGAQAGSAGIPQELKSGLRHAEALAEEIAAFVAA
eukprot:CAMPEP_0115351490 /NCGR_PEP_ID=MMETSP0270-20121206/97020_1 /TAXON_ID=71861 /ORGANISM="Scrippsiella trochoidea, Strain CCMP3099" /LENGTH=149 /DNA_ID=CAMNT_0002773639 /DNA_START=105 /DNA_END=550 /DNA_ORIENTATION=-